MQDTEITHIIKDPLIIYHANCMDGFAAACVIAKHLQTKGVYLACQYGDQIPDIVGKDVYIVDFSWKLDGMQEIARRANHLWWIDHHATSADYANKITSKNSFIVHSQKCSGAVLAWRTFFNEREPPVLSYVQDRDLWTWELPSSRAVSAAVALHWPFGKHDPRLSYSDFLNQNTENLISLGSLLLGAQKARVNNLLKRAVPVSIDGHHALAINSTGDISELGEALDTKIDIGIIYFCREDGQWVHSLRSKTCDVSLIAKKYGGGGHPGAAGFVTKLPITMW